MQKLEKNVKNIWGIKGQNWLNELPLIIESLERIWSLTEIKPVKHMNYNYVALAIQHHRENVVLKVGCDEQLIADERKALLHFDGQGAIKVLDFNEKLNALLLEQAVPGCLLKELYSTKIEETIKIYAEVAHALFLSQKAIHDCLPVSQWCAAIDRVQDPRLDPPLLQKAKELRASLLGSVQTEYVCHGDLHLENIVQQGKYWLAIDPKGIVGEMAFEAAAFDLINKEELKDTTGLQQKIVGRTMKLSEALNLNYNRLLSWMFLRAIISIQWFIEDNGDPNEMLILANHLYLSVKNIN